MMAQHVQEPEVFVPFRSSVLSIHDLYGREDGFVIPDYQREYTWEKENIDQLFDDIIQGIRDYCTDDTHSSSTFLGTVIFVNIGYPPNYQIADHERARPTAVRTIVDGQQRLATIGILAIHLAHRLDLLRRSFDASSEFASLNDAANYLIRNLSKLFCVNIDLGSDPSDKPKIIRLEMDRWTFRGGDENYKSPLTKYVAKYIRTNCLRQASNAVSRQDGARLLQNVDVISQWLDHIESAHTSDSELHEVLPTGPSVAQESIQRHVLRFFEEPLRQQFQSPNQDLDTTAYAANAFYQIALVAFYLLRRCGVNLLQTEQAEYGFDMFQALNATGTPLTAMETFLPEVIHAEMLAGNTWFDAPSREHWDQIEGLFETTQSNAQKSTRTNELLRNFALIYNGEKLLDQFSSQRRWMMQRYQQSNTDIVEKRDFVKKMSDLAVFFKTVWYMDNDVSVGYLRFLSDVEGVDDSQTQLVAFLVRYLRDANSRLSAPILARYFYGLTRQAISVQNFIDAVKICAAFFTLWRSTHSTSGLDQIYRRFFQGSDNPVHVNPHSYNHNAEILSAESLRTYFRQVLLEDGIIDEESWIGASDRFMLYTEIKTVCRFILFLACHDQIPDDAKPGLSKNGRPGCFPLMSIGRWLGDDQKTLDHIAPQNPPDNHDWDDEIYSGNTVHHIGNLTLLPREVNAAVANKGWDTKFLHYAHLGERDPDTIQELTEQAEHRGITLSRNATSALKDAEFSGAIEPLLTIGIDGVWDAELIADRSRRIKEIAWSRLSDWLSM